MTITDSLNDQLMMMAAHRYCLGRSSYIVGAALDFFDQHWSQLTPHTQGIILRDIKEALDRGMAGMDIDARGWQEFVKRHSGDSLRGKTPAMVPECGEL